MKIRPDTFVVMSKFEGDATWIKDYTSEYIIYDKSNDPLGFRDVRIPNVGYNLYAYFTYIIEHYSNLPDRIMFIKNNILTRHFSKEYFESVMNNDYFTPLVEKEKLQLRNPDSYWDNGYHERHHLNMYSNLLYVRNPEEFYDMVYQDYHRPTYHRFAPGANYIVPKGQILRLPKLLYQHMRTMVEHHQFAGESHIIERCLDTLWTSGKPIKENFIIPTI